MTSMVKTAILMAALTALFLIGGQALAGRSGMTIALGVALAMNFFTYWCSDKIALAMNRARQVSESEAPTLHQIAAFLASRAELPKPRLYVIDDQTPNAFATGRNPRHAAVAITRGLLELLNRDELEGVLAHELAHIRNRDILISSMAAVMAGAISYLASMRGSDKEGDGGGAGLLSGIVMMIVAPLAATIIQLTISRSREFQADSTGAAICGRPPLARQCPGQA